MSPPAPTEAAFAKLVDHHGKDILITRPVVLFGNEGRHVHINLEDCPNM